jgi:putative YhbY family RNA-binding protein
MSELSPARRRELRALAHHLHPVVTIGQGGLSAAVLREIHVNLLAHELIKIRVQSDDRGAREALMEAICAELGAAPVQHIGKLLLVYRPAPRDEARPAPSARAAARTGGSQPSRAPAARSGSPRPGRARSNAAALKPRRRRRP